MKSNDILKLSVFFGVLVLAVIIFTLTDIRHLSQEDIQSWLQQYGTAAAIVFVLVYCIAALLLAPSWMLSVTSGILFGPYMGAVLTLVGANAGALIVFLFARYFAGSLREKFVDVKRFNIQDMNRHIEKNGFRYMLFIRLIPLFPYNLLNYGFAFTKIKTKDFVLGTLIGMIPISFTYAYFGSNVLNPGSRGFYYAIALFTFLVIVPILLRKKIQGHKA